MYLKNLLFAATLLVPATTFGASKEQQEMQRDIAQLQSQVQTLQSAFDRNMATLTTLVQQALDAANKANTGVSVVNAGVTTTLERTLRENLTPIAGLAAKIDNTNNDVAEIRHSVEDLNTSMNKVLQILTDMNNTMKVLQAPAAAPPPGNSMLGGAGAAPSSAPGGAAPPASVIFANAKNDQNGGKLDLALSEYADFLRFYPDDPNGASAQFNIGEIHYTQNKMDLAVQDWDAIIERYSDNKLTPDAYFMKGMALKASSRKDAAASTFRALIAKYPHSTRADEAKEQMHTMGYTVPAAQPTAAARRRR